MPTPLSTRTNTRRRKCDWCSYHIRSRTSFTSPFKNEHYVFCSQDCVDKLKRCVKNHILLKAKADIQ